MLSIAATEGAAATEAPGRVEKKRRSPNRLAESPQNRAMVIATMRARMENAAVRLLDVLVVSGVSGDIYGAKQVGRNILEGKMDALDVR